MLRPKEILSKALIAIAIASMLPATASANSNNHEKERWRKEPSGSREIDRKVFTQTPSCRYRIQDENTYKWERWTKAWPLHVLDCRVTGKRLGHDDDYSITWSCITHAINRETRPGQVEMQLTAEWESKPGERVQQTRGTLLRGTITSENGSAIETVWRQYVPAWVPEKDNDHNQIFGTYDAAWQPQSPDRKLGAEMVQSLIKGENWHLKLSLDERTIQNSPEDSARDRDNKQKRIKWRMTTTIEWTATKAERKEMQKWLNGCQPKGI